MQAQYYTVKEAAAILKTQPSTVRTYCRNGKIPAVRVGRGYRIGHQDLEKWLAKQKQGPAFLLGEQARLQETEARYRNLFENASDAIALFGDSGRLTLANPRFYRLYGYTPDEAKGMHFARFVYPGDLPLATERFMSRMAGEEVPGRYEARAVRKGGEVFMVELNSSSFMKDGKASGIQVIIRDVSERRKAEKAVKESEARYRGVVEDQSELICRWAPDGKLIFVNEAYCRYFQKTREQLIGHSFMPLIPEEDQIIVEKYVSQLTPKNPTVTYEHRVFDSHGRIRWIQWTDRLISDEERHGIGYQSVGRDVTEQKQAQQKLRESEDMYKMLIKASPDSIVMIDIEGKLVYVSDQTLELHGFRKAEELLGTEIFNLVHPQERERARAVLQEILNKGMVRNLEFTLARKDGTAFAGEMSAALIRDDQENPKAIIATARDITRRKQSEKEKEMLSRAVETSGEGIAIVDENQKFTYVNGAFARAHGYKAKELIGKAWTGLISKDCSRKMGDEVRKTLLATGRWRGPCEAVRKDGEPIWIGLSLTVFKNREGESAGFVIVLRDYLK
jgi:PAS domain S-box-containing protein/excisionase family DNA binding protein